MEEQIQLLSKPQTVPYAAFENYLKLGVKRIQKAAPARTEAPTGTPSQRIKASIRVADFVGQYVELGENGRGLCPFHDDDKASFSVNDDQNYWHCFAGCGGGSIINFWSAPVKGHRV
jgi:hypothetical protein